MPSWGIHPAGAASFLQDLPIMLAGVALFYALLALTHQWMAPVTGQTEINLSPRVLPKYAMFSVCLLYTSRCV